VLALLLVLLCHLHYRCTSLYTQALQESEQEQLCDEDLLPEDVGTDVSKAVGHSLNGRVNGRAMDVDSEEPQLQSLLLDDDTADVDELDIDSTAVAAAVWDGTGTFKMKTADLQV
jgi:hypothetical protein